MKNISCIIYFTFQKYFQKSSFSFYFQLTKMYLFYFSFS